VQHAGERRCGSCRFRAECHVCPIGRRWNTRAGESEAVPEYLCAFNRLLQRHAGRFRRAAGLEVAGSARLLRRLLSQALVTI